MQLDITEPNGLSSHSSEKNTSAASPVSPSTVSDARLKLNDGIKQIRNEKNYGKIEGRRKGETEEADKDRDPKTKASREVQIGDEVHHSDQIKHEN